MPVIQNGQSLDPSQIRRLRSPQTLSDFPRTMIYAIELSSLGLTPETLLVPATQVVAIDEDLIVIDWIESSWSSLETVLQV